MVLAAHFFDFGFTHSKRYHALLVGVIEALGDGDSPDHTEWSEDRNIRWKLALPGVGHSTPVIWGYRILLTAAAPYGDPVETKPDRAHGAHDNSPVTQLHEFMVMAVSRSRGDILWKRTVRKELYLRGELNLYCIAEKMGWWRSDFGNS